MATSVQAAATSASGSYVVLDEDPPVAGQREHRRQGLGPLLGGEGVVGVAEDVERLAAQDGRRERRRVGRGAAEVDQPTARRHGPAGRRRPPQPNTGSTTTSAGPSSASVSAAASSATSPDCGSVTTASAPAAAGAVGAARRGTRPTTRPAPRAVAAPIADLADGAAGAEHEHPLAGLQPRAPGSAHIHAATPDSPKAAATVSSTPSVERHHVGVRDRAPLGRGCRRRASSRPTVANHTRVPAGRSDSRPRRRPGRPGRTAAPARRSTTCRTRTAGPAARRATAVTRTSAWPSAAVGSGCSAYVGGSPGVCRTAARTALRSRCRGRAA